MTTSAVSHSQIQTFLAETSPFDRLSEKALQTLLPKCQLLGYRTGQPIFERDKLPTQITIIYQGQARLLGFDPRAQRHVSLGLLGAREIMGWGGLIRGVPCETAIASTDTICITLSATDFLQSVAKEQAFGEAFRDHASLSEVFDLLSQHLQQQAIPVNNIKTLAQDLGQDAIVLNLLNGNNKIKELKNLLDPNRIWLVSSGTLGTFTPGSQVVLEENNPYYKAEGIRGVRLIGLREPVYEAESATVSPEAGVGVQDSGNGNRTIDLSAVAPAPDVPPIPETTNLPKSAQRFPVVRGRGKIDAPLACFNMIAKFFGINFKKDIVRRVLDNQLATVGNISLQACGAVTQMLGINAQLVQVPSKAIGRLKAPAMVAWKDSFAILYSITERELILASPEKGLTRMRPGQFAEIWGEEGQVLLLQAPRVDQKEQFSFWWFLPALMEHRATFVEVLLSSFFIQVFGLVNPLVSMVIIDAVIGQGNLDVLNILGILLLGFALFEGLLTALRTYLFVDSSNRVDIKLTAEIIDHMLRLPLGYFDNRQVGDLMSRFNELGNIRNFLTGTALTVVLDAVFSVVYVAVMFALSPTLTLVALAPLPLFAGIIFVFSPVIMRLIRKRAGLAGASMAYIVEVISGIQTIKSQTIELTARWRWQGMYARFMSASLQTTLTQTAAGTMSDFLNKIGGIALLWVGAYLVIEQQLTIGGLIAFRIISGNVTGSLLRFISVYQQIQEVSISVERLRDIIDTLPEADEADRNNIPLPEIEGSVTFEEVSFRFNPTGPLQLANINLDFPSGSFVAIVGLSGSGKSTMMKLLQRLYAPLSGRILVDGYDINKVELYSVRRQLGVVLQDTLLFNGTVQDNIGLSNPEASTDEIIRAAKIAAAHDFIMGLPNGYNTQVGERGSALSGGQRQRVAIARTVLQNPKLLILDEATSALDYQSERAVINHLMEAFHDRTVFFITHRLSAVKNADVIIMMDQGSVVEQGNHDELVALKGRYYCLYQQQEAPT
ncbi:Toxin secretion ABC transporter ATP-binding protein [Planktothrix serta PCC 8927]|uniref:Toxin secretion ABC transporter ATP-binding protein n=1 Tax=Planktothrix serta PCC 8927 TaxID=671068 RepID=A0A7Z9BRT4_9CYAN|nr:peptidase domain-containing ABC transporter [Planktothrix serta]VXD21546.1 Toxin secretion ABC transporter ATP-binding protein [Planktothrix serta PCC 8927]